MAAYTQEELNSGSLGEVLTGAVAYTFTIATPAYTSQSVYFGSATFMTDSSTITNAGLQGSSTNPKRGSLYIGSALGIQQNFTTTVNDTFLFFVNGSTRGSGAQLSLTSTGGTLSFVIVDTKGVNYQSGDTITILQADLIAGGFTTANQDAIFNITVADIDGEYVSSDFSGTFANFTTDVSQSNFISSSRGFAFNIQQDVGSGAGTFDFTPTTTIPVNSYYLKSTGAITLSIDPA